VHEVCFLCIQYHSRTVFNQNDVLKTGEFYGFPLSLVRTIVLKFIVGKLVKVFPPVIQLFVTVFTSARYICIYIYIYI
jgi:hypothetical protein